MFYFRKRPPLAPKECPQGQTDGVRMPDRTSSNRSLGIRAKDSVLGTSLPVNDFFRAPPEEVRGRHNRGSSRASTSTSSSLEGLMSDEVSDGRYGTAASFSSNRIDL